MAELELTVADSFSIHTTNYLYIFIILMLLRLCLAAFEFAIFIIISAIYDLFIRHL